MSLEDLSTVYQILLEIARQHPDDEGAAELRDMAYARLVQAWAEATDP